MPITSAQVQRIQSHPSQIRNFCVLAHIDHGKTTLSDGLLASNGIISSKQAGHIRYLDSRPDEQDRGITMKSSSIALHYQSDNTEFLINLIDCPGHVDFSSEVGIASRLCDGALVLVDVVEGVCTQTYTVLNHAYAQHLTPILVLNKIDRLITGMRLTSIEAFVHLEKLIQQVNAIWATFLLQSTLGAADSASRLDVDVAFSPQAGNVVFASAVNGWAFQIHDFARLYASKLNIKFDTLLQYLWGEYYLDPKTKRVLQPNQLNGRRSLKPLAVQFMLDNIWAIYDAFGLTVTSQVPNHINHDKLEKIITTLQLKVPTIQRELLAQRKQATKSTSSSASTVLSAWLPLSRPILESVIKIIPSPLKAQPTRLPKLLPMLDPLSTTNPDLARSCTTLGQSVYGCDSSQSAPVVAYLSKLITVKKHALPNPQLRSLSQHDIQQRRLQVLQKYNQKYNGDAPAVVSDDAPIINVNDPILPKSTEVEDEDVIIGMTRLYSGRIRSGDKLWVLKPKYDPTDPSLATQITVEHIYLLMGPDVDTLDEVHAGNIVGIRAKNNAEMMQIVKCATLASTRECPSLVTTMAGSAPIVRVAIEPVNPMDMDVLVAGLQLLNQSDPAVELVVTNSGEHVISASGELHLQRCLVDLRESYAKCAISVSDPIVSFRETIVPAEDLPSSDSNIISNYPAIEVTTANKQCTIHMRIVPLPEKLVLVLIKEEPRIRAISKNDPQQLEQLKAQLKDAVMGDALWTGWIDRIWSFGPKRHGPNMLINTMETYQAIWTMHEKKDTRWDSSIEMGFQLAMQAGPLCGEPMQGVCVCIDEVDQKDSTASGHIISTVRDAIKQQVMDSKLCRLMLAVYDCEIQCLNESLGNVYTSILKRNGTIHHEYLKEGTPYYMVQSTVPVIESFGFIEQIYNKTKGVAAPQLVFAGYKVLLDDVARKYIDLVRRRKGMLVGVTGRHRAQVH